MEMTENTTNEAQSSGGSGSAGADPLSSPAGGGGSEGFDAVETAASSKVPQGAAVLLLVALIGGGAIFTMRQFGLGSGFRYDDITIDYPIDAKPVSDSDDYAEVISDLTDHSLPHVALAELRPKPFELESGPAAEEEFASVSGESEEARLARERAERDAMLQREFARLTLNSVIGGSRPIARVSGQAVRPGDIIDGIFYVTQISGRAVHLEAEGRRYTLTMAGN